MDIRVPLTVPPEGRGRYLESYRAITHGTGRLMLFAGDQKVEHLNDDFYGPGIAPEDGDPEHLFRIASEGRIGAFATQVGLIARYGMDYPDIPYVVKLNSRTNLISTSQADPRSLLWTDVKQVAELAERAGIRILGVGYTVYLGSEHEADMLREACQVVLSAHHRGMVAVLWMYPRGRAVSDEGDPHLIAGAAGVGASLGADFVKVNYPAGPGISPAEALREAVRAAGRTKVICAGGKSIDAGAFLQRLHDQIHISGAAGNATGRNIHQRPLDEAVRLCNAIYAITVENSGVDEAIEIYQG